VASPELHVEARRLLLELALTSNVRGRFLTVAVAHARRGSAPPPNPGEHPAERWAVEFERLVGTKPMGLGAELERFVRDLRAELDQVPRRPLAQVSGESLEDLETAVVDRGEGWDARTVAVALRTSERLVARIRVANGLDERGRPKRINGTADGLALLHAGLSLRAASMICGVPRSTLHDRARRAR
jgi:hypothetical protein